MRATVFPGLFVLAAFTALAACSVSVDFKLPKRFNGTEQKKEAVAEFNLEEIQIANKNGELKVVGDSSVTKITALVKPFALAPEDTPQSDADEALKDIYASLVVTESAGKVTVNCGQAATKHGKVETGNTGCDLTIKIPTGKGGVKLTALSGNGSLSSSGLTAADGAQVDLKTDNGSLDATVSGGAKRSSGNDDVTVSLTPPKAPSSKSRAATATSTSRCPATSLPTPSRLLPARASKSAGSPISPRRARHAAPQVQAQRA